MVVYLTSKIIEPISVKLCQTFDPHNDYCDFLTSNLLQLAMWMTMDIWKSTITLFSVGKLGMLFLFESVVNYLMPTIAVTKEYAEYIIEETSPTIWETAKYVTSELKEGGKLVNFRCYKYSKRH